MDFIILWSDYFVYALFIMAFWLFWQIYHHENLKASWRRVISRPLNVMVILVLSAYCLVGLMDSIHFSQKADSKNAGSTGIISLLDKILSPMVSQTESTYSAPFSLYSFVKETIVLPDGEIVRDYPRLKFAGAHIQDPQQKWHDIQRRLSVMVWQTIILFAVFTIVCLGLACRRQKRSFEDILRRVVTGKLDFPWRTFLLSIGLSIFIIVFINGFMPYYHILGTDQVGEDVLYQTIKSIRTGLIIGTVTTMVMLPFAIILGTMAGYFRGWIDDAIQYTYTTLSSVPAVLLIAAAVLTLQLVMERHADLFQTIHARADARLLALCAILGITSWTELCRYLRGETLKICQMDYIQAAHALGVKSIKILFKHVLPNVMHIILITIALNFSGLVLAEAVLTYVGVGVDPSTYSWGMMINSARLEIARVPMIWWSLTAAFIFMFVLVLSANIFSDAVRDAFDPQSQN